jgi:hypothetical protein
MNRNEGRGVANKRAGVLSEKLECRIATYVAGAGAAGVGLLALVQPAEAQVVYTPAHVVIRPGTNYDLDLNNDGHTDFMFADTFLARTSVGSFFVSPFDSNQGQIGNGVEVQDPEIFSPLALNRGARIGGSKAFYGSCVGCNSSIELMAWADPFAEFGNWVNVQNRYLGVKLVIDHEAHYGWARFSVQVEKNKVTALLTGYAYEATPNKPILAGQTSGSASDEAPSDGSQRLRPTPQAAHGPISQAMPALPGILALGAQGLPLWRNSFSGATE